MPEWNDERVAILRKMFADGETAAAIAAATGMTRGAISGKTFRLGLCTPRNEQWGKGKQQVIKSRGQRERENAARRTEYQAEAEEYRLRFATAEIVDLPPEQTAATIPFGKLSNDTCRWPSGNPRDLKTVRFCGEQPIDGRPYYLRRCRMAYVPRIYRPKFMQAAE